MKRKLLSMAAVAACAFSGAAQAQISDGIVKIGVMNDMSGLYADITGPGSLLAARMAVEDYIMPPAASSRLKLSVQTTRTNPMWARISPASGLTPTKLT